MNNYTIYKLLLCLLVLWDSFYTASSVNINVADWNFSHVKNYFAISMFVLCLLIVKFVHNRVRWINDFIPESFILLVIGTIFGLIMRFGTNSQRTFELSPNLFFLILLPPIVLNSAYEMTTRSFYRVYGICIMYAVMGTIFNFLLIGFSLHGIIIGGTQVYGYPQISLTLRPILLFASLIVAVDPVAVLAIFSDIGVDHELYFIVFGESLLNDAVTVVLYNIMKAFLGNEPVSHLQVGLGIISFFTVSLGGLLIGLIFGIISCLVTRIYDNKFEVAVLILLGYISYILADTITWSGIIALIGCGIVQAEYSFTNISPESLIVLRNVIELWANLSEGAIFLFLGESLSFLEIGWHTGFIFWSMFICLLARAIVCGGLGLLNNLINLEERKISLTELIIIIYGGLRGAVAYSLAVLIESSKLDGSNSTEKEYNKNIIITTTLFIILFTVAFHGLTMKPLVKLLKIKITKVEDLSLFKTSNMYVIDTTLSAIEGLTGETGQNMIREKLIRWNNHYIRPFLQKSNKYKDDSMLKVIEKMSLAIHYALVKPEKSEIYLHEIPERLRYKQSVAFSQLFFQNAVCSKTDQDKCKKHNSSFVDALAKTRLTNRRATNAMKNPQEYFREVQKCLLRKQKMIEEKYPQTELIMKVKSYDQQSSVKNDEFIA